MESRSSRNFYLGFCLASSLALLLTPLQVFVVHDVSTDQNSLNLLLWLLDCFRIVALWVLRSSKSESSSFLTLTSIVPFVCLPLSFAWRIDSTYIIMLNLFRLTCVFDLFHRLSTCRSIISSDYHVQIQESTLVLAAKVLLTICYAITMASVWYYLGYHYYESDTEITWLSLLIPSQGTTAWSGIILSFYFLIQTSFTIGFGDIHPTNLIESLFSIALIFNSLLILAYLISSTASFLENRDVSRNRLRGEMDLFQSLLTHRGISSSDIDNVRLHYDFLYGKQLGMLESRFIMKLPCYLQRQIAINYVLQLESVPFFRYQTSRLREKMILRMEYRAYTPGSIMFIKGELRRELMLIRSGRVEMYRDTNHGAACTCLVAGDFVGDHNLLFGVECDMFVKACAFTEVLVLNYVDFMDEIGCEDRLLQELHVRRDCNLEHHHSIERVDQTSIKHHHHQQQKLSHGDSMDLLDFSCESARIIENLIHQQNDTRNSCHENGITSVINFIDTGVTTGYTTNCDDMHMYASRSTIRATALRATFENHFQTMSKFEKVASTLEKKLVTSEWH